MHYPFRRHHMNHQSTIRKRIIAIILTMVMVITAVTVPTHTSEAATVKRPAKVTIRSISRTNRNKTITIKVKKVNKATGYQIAYKTKSAKKYTLKKIKKTTYKLTVKASATYQVKVRAYRKSGKTTSYGKWSDVVTLKKKGAKHRHNWVTITDKEAWDESVYVTKEVYIGTHWYWPDGTQCDELADPCAKQRWCAMHCTSCFPDCPEPDPHGRCAVTIYDTDDFDYQEVQVDTIHHPAKTHQECSKCGARK